MAEPECDIAIPAMRSPAKILAVLVLYRMQAQESPAYRSLLCLREQDPEIAHSLDLLVWDNSPEPKPRPPSLKGSYHQDTRNPGLSAAYSHGLEQAAREGIPWLLLLDQDTEITAEFLSMLLQAANDADAEVGAIVPRLLQAQRIVSPLLPRRLGPPAVYTGSSGPLRTAGTLQAFNSGAAFRVATLTRMGGFDPDFPLDYLDHATFSRLQRDGGRICILPTALQHSLSTNTGLPSTAAQRERLRNILMAERRFYRVHGSRLDRMLHPIRLLRRAASELVKKRDLPAALQILRHLF